MRVELLRNTKGNKIEDALNDYNAALLLDSTFEEAYYRRGLIRIKNAEWDKAIDDFTRTLGFSADRADVHIARGDAETEKHDFDSAISDYTAAIKLGPTNSAAFRARGLVFIKTGQWKYALDDCNTATRMNPKDFSSYNDLAWILSVCPDAKLRNGKQALDYARIACDLTKWNDAYCLGNLAAAYAELGKFAEEVTWEIRSYELSHPANDSEREHELLNLYLHGRAYRAVPK